MKVHALFGDESALMDRILGLRRHWPKAGAAVPEGDPLRKQITDFDAKVDAVRNKSSPRPKAAPSPAKKGLREHTDQLYGAILSYEGKPAAYQIAYIDTLKRELDAVTKQFDQLLAQDLPALNDSLKSKGQQPLSTPDAKVGTNEATYGSGRGAGASSALPADFRISYQHEHGARIRKHSSGSAEDWKLIFRAPMERKPAVAVVFHHIGPYHHARLNAAADRLSVTGIEWSAKGYDAWGAAKTPDRYAKVSLFPEATDRSPGNADLRCAFWSALKQTNPDVVAINGWNNFGSLIAANCCVRCGIPMIVMSESARQDEPRTWWKEAMKRRMVDLFPAALVGGQRHVEYLVELGMPRERVFIGYDVVDNHYFRQKSEEVRSQRFVRLCRGYGGQGDQKEVVVCRSITFLPQRGSSRRKIFQG